MMDHKKTTDLLDKSEISIATVNLKENILYKQAASLSARLFLQQIAVHCKYFLIFLCTSFSVLRSLTMLLHAYMGFVSFLKHLMVHKLALHGEQKATYTALAPKKKKL